MRSRSYRARALLALCAGLLLTTACEVSSGDSPTDPTSRATGVNSSGPESPTQSSAAPEPLAFDVFGNAAEVQAWETAVSSYNSVYGADVRLRSYGTWQRADAALRDGSDVPDLYMINRRTLARHLDAGLTQPVDELLDERGINFGDDYSRDAMEAFSVDTSLACMPVSMSPMVIYLNTELVDFEAMAARELDVPPNLERWSLEQFAAAADFAARPRRAIRGVYIDPTLTGLSPFIYSGGGAVYDDVADPASLSFSSEETNSALERTLEVLRDPQLTPDSALLADRSAVEMFSDGDLGMIAGFRNLAPRLEAVDDLTFDVMPMPVLDSRATVAEMEGICLAADTEQTAAAADFLAFAMSESTIRGLARAGRTVPANVAVANSPDFLQPWKDPQNAVAFIASMRRVRAMPLLTNGEDLRTAVRPLLRELLTEPVLDLPLLTGEIDEASQAVLAPDGSPEAPSSR